MFGLDPGMATILIVCLIAACIFEFINGFHDTANSVAAVIYSNSLKPASAVIMSGIFNFIGVYFGGIGVAIGIINLLPVTLLVDQSMAHGLAMIGAIILSAIIWNFGTWYFGIPCSSSHTLIGSIFGVGLAYGLLPDSVDVALNWAKVKDAILSLFISPVIGFGLAFLTIHLMKKYLKKKKLFHEPEKKKKPPFWIRTFLIFSSAGLSWAHGSNDGQKGVGLIMIILIGLVPFRFAVDHNKRPEILLTKVNAIETVIDKYDVTNASVLERAKIDLVKEKIDSMQFMLSDISNFSALKKESGFKLRKDILLLADELPKLADNSLNKQNAVDAKEDKKLVLELTSEIRTYTEYAPSWVILVISLSLGLGTMVGWKRIVVTIGEKIGKDKLNYAQGASANLVSTVTIGLSTFLHLPVSTTHVLSSAVAGSMVGTSGKKNLSTKTVSNIFIAWLITLPVTIILSGGLYLLINALL
jgi:PiT family inorganic phosphate transporter